MRSTDDSIIILHPKNPITTRSPTCADVFATTALVAAMSLAGMANATPILTTWTGNVNSNWDEAGNWNNGLPALLDSADIGPYVSVVNQPTLGTTTPGLTSTSVYAGTLTIASGGNLVSTAVTIAGTGRVETAGVITGAVLVADTGVLALSGNATVSTFWGNGAVQLGSNTLTVDPSSDRTSYFSGVISGTGGLIKSGGGTQVLTGANTYTGTTTLEAGDLTLSGGSAIADTGAVVVNGGTLTLENSETIGALSGGTGGTIDLGTNTLTVSPSSVSSTYEGMINGAGGLTKTGSGTLALSGVSTYTGDTILSAGTLAVSNSAALGSTTGNLILNGGTLLATADASITKSNLKFNDNATLAAASNKTLTITTSYLSHQPTTASTLTIGSVGQDGTVVLSVTGTVTANSTPWGFDVVAGTLQAGNSFAASNLFDFSVSGLSIGTAGTLNLNGFANTVANLTGTGSIVNNTNTNASLLTKGTTDFGGVIADGTGSGLTSLNVTSGTTTLTGANTYTGGTTVSGGTLQGSSTSLQGNILNNAMVNFDQATDGTYASAMTGTGSLIKSGTGTLLLTGANTYSGGTTVSAGTLQGNSASLQGNILNNAMLNFDQATDGTYASAMTGTGSLIKSGTGTLLLTGANTYSGGTTVSAGTLQGNSASLQGNILNNAMVNFDQATDGTYASAMTGTGSLIKSGTGTLLLTGANTYSGGTTVSAGTLQGNSASLQGNILNNAMVSFDQAVNGTFAGAISGSGGLIKTGAGALTLSGTNTYSGATFVNGGLLTVNGSIANSALTLSSGGRLGGTGTFGSMIVNGGVLAPGNSIGTQTVNGNLTLSGASTYEVETDPAGSSSDLVQVNGVANLGGQVRHVGESGTYLPFSTYTILSATGGFAGSRFAGVTSDFAFLTPSLTYDLNNVYLDLQRNSTAVADLAQSRNQLATAGALDSLPTGGALSGAILGLQTNAVPEALNALSGEVYASAAGAVLQNSQAFSNSLLQRSGRLLDESQRSALPLWIETQGATRRNDGDSNSAEATQRGGSVAVGGELAMPNDWVLGGAFRYGDHRLSVDQLSSHADIDSYSVGLYGRWAQPLDGGSLRMTLGGIYGWHSIDAERDIYTTGLQQSLNSDYDATSGQVFAELGYAMDVGSGIQLEPYVGLSWTQVASDSFTEKGGNAALHADSQNEDMTASTLGLRSQLPLNNGQFQLDAGLGWQHNYNDVNPETDLNFVGSSSYSVEGASLGRDTALLDLGASYRIAPDVTVRAGYSGQFGDNVSSNGGNLTLIWEL